jgi:hypothetical protein
MHKQIRIRKGSHCIKSVNLQTSKTNTGERKEQKVLEVTRKRKATTKLQEVALTSINNPKCK